MGGALASHSTHPNQGHNSVVGKISMELAHARLGDLCENTLAMIEQRDAVDGLRIAISNTEKMGKRCKCKVCMEANLRVATIPKRRTRNLRVLQVVGSDTQSMPIRSYDNKNYFIIFADHESGFTATVNVSKKSEQEQHTYPVLLRMERMAGNGERVEVFRADQGGEFTANRLAAELYTSGIKQEFSDTAMAFQNGLPEVLGGKLVAMTRAALVRSAVPESYWSLTVKYMTWIHNRVPLRRHRGWTTPIEALTGQRSNLSRARVWGCEAWVVIRRKLKEKLSRRAERAVFMGVSLTKKAWVFLLWDSKKIMESRNAVFYENEFPYQEKIGTDIETRRKSVTRQMDIDNNHQTDDESAFGPGRNHDDQHERDTGDNGNGGDLQPIPVQNVNTDDSGTLVQEEEHAASVGLPRRSMRATRRPDRFAEINYNGISRVTRESTRNQERPRELGAAKRGGSQRHPVEAHLEENGDHENMRMEIDDRNVEEEVADQFEPGSGPDDAGDVDDENIPCDTSDSHIGWACLCSAGNADDGMFAMLTGEVSEDGSDPKSEKEARSSHMREEWCKAMDEEYEALIDANVADVVDRPADKPVLPSKFVYKTKRDEIGATARYKARFVPLGCCDPWKALKETFAPTLRYATLRVIISLAATMGLVIHQLDVKTAFLNGVLKDPVYVEQPSGYENGNPAKKVWKLKKALYGLVEAPRLWYETLNQALMSFGFKRITGDPCLYVLKRECQIVILGVFVDDFLVFGTSESMVSEVKSMLGKRFKTKDLGTARWVLGMKLMQSTHEYVLDQTQYLKDVLIRYEKYVNMTPSQVRAAKTPLPLKMKMSRSTIDDVGVDLPYRELLGSIGHLAIGTRVDITFAVSLLARYASKPKKSHWDALVHVLRYLAEHSHEGLMYKKNEKIKEFNPEILNGDQNSEPSCVVDSDFANDPDTAKSVGGMIVSLAGTAVSWRSKLLRMVATSTCHAEYMAAYEGIREIVWLRMLLEEIGFNLAKPSGWTKITRRLKRRLSQSESRTPTSIYE